jgi:Spy/CpxP family protein refolding chaperone
MLRKEVEKMKKVLTVVILLVLVFGIAQVAMAANEVSGTQSQGTSNCQRKMNRLSLFEDLDLTSNQITEYKQIKETAYQDTRDLRIKLMDLRHQLDLLVTEGQEDAINKKQEEIKEVRDQIMQIEKAAMEQFKGLLSEEQQTVFDKFNFQNPGCGMGKGQRQGTGSGFGGNGQCQNVPFQNED